MSEPEPVKQDYVFYSWKEEFDEAEIQAELDKLGLGDLQFDVWLDGDITFIPAKDKDEFCSADITKLLEVFKPTCWKVHAITFGMADEKPDGGGRCTSVRLQFDWNSGH